jgi:hypothetical protein
LEVIATDVTLDKIKNNGIQGSMFSLDFFVDIIRGCISDQKTVEFDIRSFTTTMSFYSTATWFGSQGASKEETKVQNPKISLSVYILFPWLI